MKRAEAPGFAPAKVNLSLHVVGLTDGGLHRLDSLVAFADIGDRLTATAATDASLTVTGPMASGVPTDDSNLVLKAAHWIGVPARFTLDKHLPAAAGIGGGSSDAAAALRLLSKLSGKPVPPGAEALGADVPVCLAPRATRMRGIGERLDPVDLPPLPALLVNPGIAVPTGAVFSALATKDNPPMPSPPPAGLTVTQAIGWIAAQRNDLQAPAIALAPEIGDLLACLADLPGARLARMSGSGATCFALFDDFGSAETAASRLRARDPAWWVAPTVLL